MKTAWKRILALLTAALFLSGCAAAPKPSEPAAEATAAPKTVEPTPEPTEEPTPEPGPFEADYALLWEILETDYPYLPYLREQGVDVDGVRETYAKTVKDAKNVESFVGIVRKVFASLKNTAHLSVLDPNLFKDMYGYLMLSPESKESTFFDPWREALMQAAEAGYYTVPKAYNDNASAFGLLSAATAQYYEDLKTLCFTVPTFYYSMIERDRDLFINAMEQYPDAENIVFDVTRNDGGDDTYWRENIVAPFGADYTFRWRDFYRNTPQNERIVEGWLDTYSTCEAENVPAWATASGLDRYFCLEIAVKGFDAIHSDAKRWVLVDKTVYSSSEEFVCFCKATGWATVIGTQTGGDGLGFNPVLRLLPDSGLLIQFSMDAGENPDGTMSIEGTVPDVFLETADVTHFLEWIRSEQAH